MKIFIISPNVNTQLNNKLLTQIESAGEVIIVNKVSLFAEIKELYEGDEPRIVAIDPDFCNWQVPNETIDSIPNLKAVCLQTTSFSWIDTEYAKQKGIPVTNLRGFSSNAVSEWATFMVLALARRVPVVVKDGWKLDYEKHRGFELRGKTAGIIGLGRIGTAVAENMAGLGMKVQYWSKHSEDSRFKKVSLEELMRSSEVIIPAVASNAETERLITDSMLESMRPTALFVSIVHPVYSHDLLVKMVAEGRIGGYAFEDEKDPFGKYDGNVWNGPALGWCTNESMTKNAYQWVESIVQAAKGEYPTRIN